MTEAIIRLKRQHWYWVVCWIRFVPGLLPIPELSNCATTLRAAQRMHQNSLQETASALISYLHTTAFALERKGAFWSALLVTHPMFNATYATWELWNFVATIFVHVLKPFNSPTTSPAASNCVLRSRHYLGVAVYVVRWGLDRVHSFAIVRRAQCTRVSYLERFVAWYVGGFDIVCIRGPFVWNPYVLTRADCTFTWK